MPRFPSLEWAKALADHANRDAEFLAVAKKYPGDSYLLICEADRHFGETHCLYLETNATGVSKMQEIEDPLDVEPRFVVSAPYSTWRECLKDPNKTVTALLRGDLTIDGEKDELLRRAKESKDLVRLLAGVSWE